MHPYHERGHKHLAWHETLELHEMVSFLAGSLTTLKKNYEKVQDRELRRLYHISIKTLSQFLKELLPFYSAAPHVSGEAKRERESCESPEEEVGYYAGQLLLMAKTAVRNYGIAITETATTPLHKVLARQLTAAVHWHYTIFQFMYHRGLYPAYDLDRLLSGDLKRAKKALALDY